MPGAGAGFNPWGLRWLFMDIPVFALTSLSVGCFYLSSQMGAYPKSWWKRAIFLPGALALGIGMAINSGRAVFEALLGMDSPFIRTPKYGIKKSADDWQHKKYHQAQLVQPLIETALGLYFTSAVIYAIYNGIFGSLPFLMLFQFGYLYLGLSSIYQQFVAVETPARAHVSN